MDSTYRQQFRPSPFAVEMAHPEHGFQLGFARELRLNFDEPDRPMVEVLSDADPRTFGIEELIVDSADEVRWTLPDGTTAWARRLRPYDAVAAGSSTVPIDGDALVDAVFGGSAPHVEASPSSLLELNTGKVWVSDDVARARTRDIADVVAHDVRGRLEIEAWRKHVPYGLLGWAPTKVPVKAANVGPSNSRFVTPTVAEMLWRGQSTGLRREHIVARSRIVAMWDEVGPDPEELAPIIWAYRFAIVLTTIDEARRIDKVGGKVGGCERYARAGIHTVYDRLQQRDVDVALLDPEHEAHRTLEIAAW